MRLAVALGYLFGALACGHGVSSNQHQHQAAPDSAARRPALDLEVVNEPGALVVIEEVVVPGKVTIVDFWADWCQACKELDEKLVTELAGAPGIVVRRIDILDDSSAVAKHYDIGVLPHVRVYDREGKLVYALIGDNAERAGALALEIANRE